MINRAKELCPNFTFSNALNELNNGKEFDLVYGIAVFAHIMNNDELAFIFREISDRLSEKGVFVMF